MTEWLRKLGWKAAFFFLLGAIMGCHAVKLVDHAVGMVLE